MAKLLNGDGYRGITAQEDADLYAGIIGNGRLLLNVGKKMAAEIVDNNTIRIYDGELVSKGRRIHIDAGTWDDFTIPTGSQGDEILYDRLPLVHEWCRQPGLRTGCKNGYFRCKL